MRVSAPGGDSDSPQKPLQNPPGGVGWIHDRTIHSLVVASGCASRARDALGQVSRQYTRRRERRRSVGAAPTAGSRAAERHTRAESCPSHQPTAGGGCCTQKALRVTAWFEVSTRERGCQTHTRKISLVMRNAFMAQGDDSDIVKAVLGMLYSGDLGSMAQRCSPRQTTCPRRGWIVR